MNKKKFLTLIASVCVLVFGVTPAFANTTQQEVVDSAETLNEDIFTSDDLLIEAGTVVNGDVAVWGANLDIEGTINGDIFVFGGDLNTLEGGNINGDCLNIAGSITNADQCISLGSQFEDNELVDNIGMALEDGISIESSQFSLPGTIGVSIFSALLGLIVTLAAPRQVDRVGSAISDKPLATGTVGVLTFISGISAGTITTILAIVLLIVCVGAFILPVAFAIFALLAVGTLVGWVAVGSLFGEMVANWLKLNHLSLPMTAALGTGLLSLFLGLLQFFPLGGFGADMATFVIWSIGLGAVALTKFGTKTYPRIDIDIDPDKLDSVMDSIIVD